MSPYSEDKLDLLKPMVSHLQKLTEKAVEWTRSNFETWEMPPTLHTFDQLVRYYICQQLDKPQAVSVLFEREPLLNDGIEVKYLVLQRDFTRLTELGDSSLPMRDVRRMVALLPVADQVQRHPGIKVSSGQDPEQQHLHLGQGQARRLFFNLRRSRTRKKWARITKVI